MVCEEVLLHVVDLIPLDAVRLIGTVDESKQFFNGAFETGHDRLLQYLLVSG